MTRSPAVAEPDLSLDPEPRVAQDGAAVPSLIPTGVDVVSWDVDGTLYRMHDVVRAVKRLALRRVLSRRFAPALWQLSQLQRFRVAMEKVRSRGGVLAPGDLPHPDERRRLLDLERHWYGVAMEQVGPWDGIVDLVDLFDSHGVRQVVVSDYEAGYKLEALGLSGRFERHYSGESVGHLKPSPGLFEAVVADLGVPPDRILHLGDRPETDGVAAAAVGCKVRIFDGGFLTPRDLFEHLTGDYGSKP